MRSTSHYEESFQNVHRCALIEDNQDYYVYNERLHFLEIMGICSFQNFKNHLIFYKYVDL